MNKPLIQCENLSFSYDGRKVLRDVNFSLASQDYLAVLGENGSGKSTLIKGLLGLKTPDTGSIRLGLGLTQKDIGYLPQQTDYQRDFPATVREIVQSALVSHLGLRPFYRHEDKLAAQEAMDKLEISSLAHKSFAELSGGQQQRVLMARALTAGKKLLILDEPFAGLDPLVSHDLYGILEEVRAQGLAIIIVSHDLHASLFHANKILQLGARQLFFGSVEEYKASEIGQLFLGMKPIASDPNLMDPYCSYCQEGINGNLDVAVNSKMKQADINSVEINSVEEQ